MLAAKSPVLAAVLPSVAFRKGWERRIWFGNADPRTVEAFLKFCCLGTAPLECDYSALLLLADQYQVESIATRFHAQYHQPLDHQAIPLTAPQLHYRPVTQGLVAQQSVRIVTAKVLHDKGATACPHQCAVTHA